MKTVPGMASPDGTARFASRHLGRVADGHFRPWPDGAPPEGRLTLSSLGLGTYLGPSNDSCDAQYHASATAALRGGVNLLDTAINYRNMRSERAIGRAVRDLVAAGEMARDEVVVMTKAGYVPFEGDRPADPVRYVQDTYLESGIIESGDLVGGMHCIAPRYLEDQLRRSRENLGLEGLDVVFLHNPEQQLDETSRPVFLDRLEHAFRFLEAEIAAERVGLYGMATWNGFRAEPDDPSHLPLAEIVAVAERVGGEQHGFRVVQLPYNLGMLEALTLPNQVVEGRSLSFLQAAAHFGLLVVTSVPLLQTQVLPHLPESFATEMPALSPAQRSIQLARSTPGVTAPLVGMRTPAHVKENLALTGQSPLSLETLQRLLGGS